jgi:hypothetical protein
MSEFRRLRFFFFFPLLAALSCLGQTNEQHIGFLFDRFQDPLTQGLRTEALGPLFYTEKDEDQTSWGIPPLCWGMHDTNTDVQRFGCAYPVFTFNRYGTEYRWQFMQILNWSGGNNQQNQEAKGFTIFPFYFHQRSADSNKNYTAFFPFYGTVKNRMFSDEISVVMFPIYCRSRKAGVTTESYMVPFGAKKHGEALEGWKVLPFAGHTHKDPTTRTDAFGDTEPVPGFDRRFIMAPFYFHSVSGIGSTNVVEEKALLPIYYTVRSPMRDSTTVAWPFVTHVEDRGRKYKEWQTPWPIIVFARGEGKHTSRVWPFYSNAEITNQQSRFYMWPLYTMHHFEGETVDRTRTRIAYFFYSDINEKNKETGKFRDRKDMWPFFTYKRDLDGNSRLQLIAPLEPILPFSESIEREYSPVWSFWRGEKNPTTGAASYSFFWNLYRRETKPDSKKCSLLFGLFQYQSSSVGKQMRLFYVPVLKSRTGTNTGGATERPDRK